MSKSKLVLIDLDMTLIDKSYNLTLPLEEVRSAVSQAQARGFIVGLNSDSGSVTLKDWGDKLGLNGPVISERGALIWLPMYFRPVEFASLAARQFPELNEDFINNLPSIGLTILGGNANVLQAEYQSGQVGERIIIINNYRERSLSFFARKVDDDGKLVIDSELLNWAVFLLQSIIKAKYPAIEAEMDEDNNPDYGIYILHSARSQKQTAVVWLLEESLLSEVWMVGDSMSDLISDERVNHVAVANASEPFKQKAKIIMEQPITAGVVEFLQSL